MHPHRADLIDRFTGLRVLVLGEAMLDTYLYGSATRLAPEAPAPVVALERREQHPGGAANTAANLAALGAHVTLLSAVGADPEGAQLLDLLRNADIDTACVLTVPGRRTLAKQRVLAGGHLIVRFDQGDTDLLEPAAEQSLIDRLLTLAPSADAVVISDYAYGILTPRLRAALATCGARLLSVDAKDLTLYRDAAPHVAKPNYRQAADLLGLPALSNGKTRVQQIGVEQERLHVLTGATMLAVTFDTEGALLLESGRPPYRTWAKPTRDAAPSGAGDTFLAALTLALAAGAEPTEAMELASLAAEVVIAKPDTAICAAAELREHLWTGQKTIEDRARLAARIAGLHAQGRRIVFTNGCFDIVHRGHVTYLNRAKALGDVLIVGVNTDESVRRLKGPERPINSLDDRLQVLAALSCVDHVVPFHEETPAALIEVIRPHLFVKGGDYTRATLPEAELVESLGGTVQILPYLDDRSTTRIIERARLGTNGVSA